MIKKIQEKIYNKSLMYGKKWGIDLPYFLKNGFWMFIKQIILIIIGFIFLSFFSKSVNQNIFGEFYYIISIVSIVSLISIPGINQSLIRSIALGKENNYLKGIKIKLLFSLLGIFILIATGLIYYSYGYTNIGISLICISLLFPLNNGLNIWDSFFIGQEDFKRSSILTVLQQILLFLITGIIIYISPNDIIYIMSGYIFTNSILNLIITKYSINKINTKIVNNSNKDDDMIPYGFFLTKISILSMIGNHIDKIIIGSLLGFHELAVYTIISSIPIKIKDFIKSFIFIGLPKLSKKNFKLSDTMKKLSKISIILIIFIFCFSFIYLYTIDILNNLLFGEEYLKYYKLSHYYLISIIMIIPVSLLGYLAQGQKNKYTIIITNPIYNILKIIITVLFIYNYGLIGGVIAYNVNFILWFILYIIGFSTYNKKILKLN